MPDSAEELEKKHDNSRLDSEYVRLVISNELQEPEADTESQPQPRKNPLVWWIKVAIWCSITIIVLLIFVKWGVPFLVEKVF